MAMCLIFFSILFISTFSPLEAKHNGFSVDLIHRDSPESPLYDPSLTSFQRLTNALHRSLHHAHYFLNHSYKLRRADVIWERGEYLMNISIGTPPVPTFFKVVTGNDLTWTQCKPCSPCFKETSPPFDPKKSKSYKKIVWKDPKCAELGAFRGVMMNNSCSYKLRYGDGSFSSGALATETLKLGKVTIPNIVFGCGHENSRNFTMDSMGIIGLGSGKLSFISQLGSTIEGKFSYCLVPITAQNKSSKINFGRNALVSSDKGAHVVTTPVITTYPNTEYLLTLQGISVGTVRLNVFGHHLPAEEGNIEIDSGTPLTYLNIKLYKKVVYEVTKQIKKVTVKSPIESFKYCYKSLGDGEIPMITMHFKNADVKLNSYNTFIQLTSSIKCLAFRETDHRVGIYGNIAQSNFLIGYDLKKKTVSFKPTDCTKCRKCDRSRFFCGLNFSCF